MQMILRGLADLPVIGADVVEVAPAYDHAELTTTAAANMAYEFLALLAMHTTKNQGDTDDQR
jgi:agmatinase